MPFTICRRQARNRMADVREALVPSRDRRGRRASGKYRRRHPLKAQRGWSVQNEHPVRAFLTFDGAATTPIKGGDYATPSRKTFADFIMLTLMLLLASCRQQMADQPRYDPYDASTFFSDGLSARPLPVGTIPRDFPTRNELLDRGTINGKAADRFPFPITMDVLHRGRERFDIYCSPCHGYIGLGDGMVARRGFRRPPASFHTDELRSAPPGRFFDVITNGFGAMPSYAYQVDTRDRWRIIAYIRALQLSQWAPANTVPADELQKLEQQRR
jgi:mono/diheme cytochrome c family protein